ncbi:MAG: hypothetical protein IJ583_01680 [Firmicutes bacterium]|nr:hypothetical protein [Bacillota bacterium]
MLSEIELLYYWDSVMLILESLNYGSKMQVTKESVEEALSCADILLEDLPKDEYEIKTGFSCAMLAGEAISELPGGIINREIQEKIHECLRNIQKSLASAFYNRYADKDIDVILKNKKHTQVMEYMIKDHILGGFEKGE